jgi:hypothetical protein
LTNQQSSVTKFSSKALIKLYLRTSERHLEM